MGRQILVAATANDLRNTIDILLSSGLKTWGRNQIACFSNLNDAMEYFQQKHVLFITSNVSRIVYREIGSSLLMSTYNSDTVELSCGGKGIWGLDTPFFYSGRVYMPTIRSGTSFEPQPDFMANMYNSICKLIRKSAVEKVKSGTRTLWIFSEAKRIMENCKW